MVFLIYCEDNYTCIHFYEIRLKLLHFIHCQENIAHCEFTWWLSTLSQNSEESFQCFCFGNKMFSLQQRKIQKERREVSCHSTKRSFNIEDKKKKKSLTLLTFKPKDNTLEVVQQEVTKDRRKSNCSVKTLSRKAGTTFFQSMA